MSDQKNLILAAVLSFIVIGFWEVFIVGPQREEARRAAEIQAAREVADPTADPIAGVAVPGADETATVVLDRDEALKQSDRVRIDSPRITGSIALKGGLIDDLELKDYHTTIEAGAPDVTLLSPRKGPAPYYALFGWFGANAGKLPGPSTPWSLAEGEILGVGKPIVLEWTNDRNVTFRQRYEIDENYLFTVTQEIDNATESPLTLRPYGIVARHGEPDTLGFFILHEGAVGAFDGVTEEFDYDEIDEFLPDTTERVPVNKIEVAENGWIGFTDKYWLTALIPDPGTAFTAAFKRGGSETNKVYQTDARLPAVEAAAGGSVSMKMHLFAGAKEAETLSAYEEKLGIDRFYEAIDWGWFYFLTKPFFWLLHNIFKVVGNFGVAIILLTVLVKAVMFPLAYKSYVSMGKMKKLQPQTEKIREKHKEDPQAMQRAMMELYKREKVNPAAGCLPILLQIPVFFALYKVLFVSLEMRHAPFFGWIRDLSAPDPTSFLNLFGALPWDIPETGIIKTLGIGIWPILMGITMWLQMQLNPAPPDPIQKKIFAWMPIIFTFMLGSFAAGLVIYWTANNVLTIAQQATIMRSQGVKIELWDNLRGMFQRKKKT